MRHGNVLSQVTIATDPVYLTEPYIRSQEFVLMERGNTNWLYNCEYAMEVPRDKNLVPHYLPGKNPWAGEFEGRHAMPREGVRGGAESLLPGWKPGAAASRPNPARNGGFAPDVLPQPLPPGDVRAVKVQGNVYMIVGAGANIAAQVGEDGSSSWTRARQGRARRCSRPSRGSRRARRSAGSSTPRLPPITSATTSRCRRPDAPSTATRRPWWRTRTPTRG